MQLDFTTGSITGRLLRFALPMMAGNLLQQCYNVADTLIVGKYLGPDALAAVGSSYTLMVFLTSILLGLCMGSGAALFHSVRPSGHRPAAAQRLSVVLPHRRSHRAAHHCRLPLDRSHDLGPAGASRRRAADAQLSLDHFSGDPRHLPLQLLRHPSAGRWKLRNPAAVSGRLRAFERGPGSRVCSDSAMGCPGRGGRHRTGAIRFRHRDRRLYPGCVSGAAGPAAAHGVGPGHPPGNFQPVPADLHPAIGDESGHSDGAGARQQLWHLRDGGVRRGGEDRFLCIYARAGFRKRLFHLRGTELRCRPSGPDPCRRTERCSDCRRILHCRQCPRSACWRRR